METLRIVRRTDFNKLYKEKMNARVRNKNQSWIIKIEKTQSLKINTNIVNVRIHVISKQFLSI